MKNSSSDVLSDTVNRSINFLLVNHPTRTSLGAVLGLVLEFLSKVFSPILNRISTINLSIINPWEYVIVGIFLMHLKTFYEAFTKKTYLSENEERAFEAIRIGVKEGKITEWEAKNMYLKLCEKVLANVELKQSTQDEIKESMG